MKINIVTYIIVAVLLLFMYKANAHTKYCEGVTIHDIRVINFETWVEYSILVHFGSPDLHMRSSTGWIKKDELEAKGCKI
jgi:hypothetical protein